MSPRKQVDPPYDPAKTYPARDAQTVAELAKYFDRAAKTYRLAATQLRDPATASAEVISRAGELIKTGTAQGEQARRLFAELLMKNQSLTQRQIATLLDVSPGTVYNWRYSPLSADELA